MKPNISALRLIDFAITEFQFKFISWQQDVPDVSELFKRYAIDIDFGAKRNKVINVIIKADINKDEELHLCNSTPVALTPTVIHCSLSTPFALCNFGCLRKHVQSQF